MGKGIRVVAASAGVLALLLVGCGSNVCERAEEVNRSVEANKKGSCDLQFTSAPRATCDANIGNCNGDDKDKLNRMLDCMEGVPVCQQGQELTWLGTYGGCGSHLEGISAECKRAFGQ